MIGFKIVRSVFCFLLIFPTKDTLFERGCIGGKDLVFHFTINLILF